MGGGEGKGEGIESPESALIPCLATAGLQGDSFPNYKFINRKD